MSVQQSTERRLYGDVFNFLIEIMEIRMNSFENICRVCLKTTEDLSPMSEDHVNLYKSVVGEIVFQEYKLAVCLICKLFLLKYSKFKLQCRAANDMLNQAYEDPKSVFFFQNFTMSHNFLQTKTDNFQYIPESTKYDFIEQANPQLATIYTNNIDNRKNDEFYENVDIFDVRKNEPFTNYSNFSDHKDTSTDYDSFIKRNDTDEDTINVNIKYEELNDCSDNVSEDEIPLLLLSKKDEEIKKKHKRKTDFKISNINMESETCSQNVTCKKQAKKKQKDVLKTLTVNINKDLEDDNVDEKCKKYKKLREGFSNRMVQETSEYIVLKRSKEQVLEEMLERSKTDVYLNLPYKCEQCVKGFNFQEVLEKHLEKHSKKNGDLLCDICGQYCPSAVSLRGHIKSHTTRYKCKVCGCVKASRQHLLEHHAAHLGAGPTYSCESCPFTTEKRTVMQRHARTHSGRAPLACHSCGKLCNSVASLRLHIARHNKSVRHKCSLCDKSFIYYSLLKRHVQCAHEKRDLYCVECDVHFTSPDSLRAHLKKAKRHRDTVENKHVCEACGASFFTSSSLAAHMSASHDAPRPHACPHCDNKHYSSRATLRAHVWRAHGRGDVRATCHHCGTTFARKSTLTAHLRTHTEEPVFIQSKIMHAHTLDKHKGEQLHQYGSKSEV